jgi:hypothetical protein
MKSKGGVPHGIERRDAQLALAQSLAHRAQLGFKTT